MAGFLPGRPTQAKSFWQGSSGGSMMDPSRRGRAHRETYGCGLVACATLWRDSATRKGPDQRSSSRRAQAPLSPRRKLSVDRAGPRGQGESFQRIKGLRENLKTNPMRACRVPRTKKRNIAAPPPAPQRFQRVAQKRENESQPGMRKRWARASERAPYQSRKLCLFSVLR